MRSLLIGLLLLLAASAFAARDLSVGWDNPSAAGLVEWYELQWRNPTDWNQVTIRSRVVASAELPTSRRYRMPAIEPGVLEVWCRACRERVVGEESECTSPMVPGWATGCCSEWATLTANEPSTPTKPVISP